MSRRPERIIWNISKWYISKNDVNFRLYNKFNAESAIKFGEHPEDQLKEEKNRDCFRTPVLFPGAGWFYTAKGAKLTDKSA